MWPGRQAWRGRRPLEQPAVPEPPQPRSSARWWSVPRCSEQLRAAAWTARFPSSERAWAPQLARWLVRQARQLSGFRAQTRSEPGSWVRRSASRQARQRASQREPQPVRSRAGSSVTPSAQAMRRERAKQARSAERLVPRSEPASRVRWWACRNSERKRAHSPAPVQAARERARRRGCSKAAVRARAAVGDRSGWPAPRPERARAPAPQPGASVEVRLADRASGAQAFLRGSLETR